MILTIHNVWTEVDADWEEMNWLVPYLTFKTIVRGYQGKRKTVSEPMLKRGRFPTGLASTVLEGARKAGYKVTIVDARVRPCEPPVTWPPPAAHWLRDYQLEALRRCIVKTRGILWLPTGAGKTEIVIALAEVLQRASSRHAAAEQMRAEILGRCRWLFLAHRGTLVNQAADRYELRTGKQAGRIVEGGWTVADFTCATYQTLHRALTGVLDPTLTGARLQAAKAKEARARALLGDVAGLIADECHQVVAAQTKGVIMQCPSAYWRIGLSGTPLDRSDGRSVATVAAIGRVIHRILPETLINSGVLARPLIRMVPCHQNWHPKGRQRKWPTVYRDLVTKSLHRNELIVETVRRAQKPAMVFVKHVKHGRKLAQMLMFRGLSVVMVDGKDKEIKRARAIAAVERGDLDVIVATVVFQEGVDVPSLRSIIVAGGGDSTIATLQRLGRGMRRQAGKGDFELWDIMDSGEDWLRNHSRGRVRAYQQDGHSVWIVGMDGSETLMPVPKTKKRGGQIK